VDDGAWVSTLNTFFAVHRLQLAPHQAAQLASFGLSRDHSVRFPDSPRFVASVFQTYVGDFRPKLF
jgi:hypothetical protein